MTIEVTLRLDVPDGIGTSEELDEWLEFELNYSGSINNENPYYRQLGDVKPHSITVNEW
jgi:hypothetical protein